MSGTRLIRKRRDLHEARYSDPVDYCIVYTSNFKYVGLLQHAIKYAYWGLSQGGKLEIVDDGPNADYIAPWTIPFSLVKMLSLQSIGDGCMVNEVNEQQLKIVLTRTEARLEDSWNAGVIFGGSEAELPVLEKSLTALSKQEELKGPNRIFVCGPSKKPELLDRFSSVRYIVYEDENPRFAISKKKNYLVSHFNAPKFVVLHARIVLAEDALKNAPLEFDFAGPNIRVGGEKFDTNYISVAAIDNRLPYARPTSTVRSTRQALDPVSYLKQRKLFIDGGVFFATKSAFEKCSLNENLSWGDAEDIEWSFRAKASGLLVDFWPEVLARSQTSKLRNRIMLGGPLLKYISILKLTISWIVNGLKYALKKARY